MKCELAVSATECCAQPSAALPSPAPSEAKRGKGRTAEPSVTGALGVPACHKACLMCAFDREQSRPDQSIVVKSRLEGGLFTIISAKCDRLDTHPGARPGAVQIQSAWH